MCGINGIFCRNPDQIVKAAWLERMGETIAYRGPDDRGLYVENNIGLEHRRLSIIDLAHGHQPMSNEDQTIWLTYNGEIYNYQELNKSLLKNNHAIKTACDTETLIHLYEEEGIAALEKINGMFAFGLWDKNQQRLLVARDRLGIKPLYYYSDDNYFVFSSELKALTCLPFINFEIDYQQIDTYMTFLYVPAPQTIFKNIKKLLPGEYLEVTSNKIISQQYWQVPNSSEEHYHDDSDLADELYQRLKSAVRLRLMSDVPLGVFLSGGLDSAALVSMMHELGVKEIKTFSIGFGNDKAYNETQHAKVIADHFNTNHFELITEPNIKESLGKIIGQFDEPIADPAAIPLFQLAEFAAQEVKVVLCGDGGDELLGGYKRYIWDSYAAKYRKLPGFIRNSLVGLFKSLPSSTRGMGNLVRLGQKFTQRAELSPDIRYLSWMMGFAESKKNRFYNHDYISSLSDYDPLDFIHTIYNDYRGGKHINHLNYVDLRSYLPYTLLDKVDRMTMSHSLEARVPFLDHNLVQWSLNLPAHLKVSGSKTKIILRKALEKKIPSSILQRKKMGFGVPLENWLKSDWLDFAKETITERGNIISEIIDTNGINTMFDEHLEGRQNHCWHIYALLTLAIWHQNHTNSIPKRVSYD